MSLYTYNRTVTATKSQVDQMCKAQDDFIIILENQTTSQSSIVNTYAAYATAILPLVFIVNAPAAIALGIVGLLASLNTDEYETELANAVQGHRDLLKTYRNMVTFGATQVNMVQRINKETAGSQMGFIKSLTVNWYLLPNGSKITG